MQVAQLTTTPPVIKIDCYLPVAFLFLKTGRTFEAEIFHNTSITTPLPTGQQYRIERPKILYNEEDSQFVMWFHLDSTSFSLTMTGVAVSDVVCGEGSYKFVSGFKPDGDASYDMGTVPVN